MKVSTASDQRRIGRATIEDRRRQRRRMRPTLLALEDRRLMSTFTVTTTLDDGSAGTLRYEIGQANTNPGDDTIDFDGGVFATPQTITLNGTELELSDKTGASTITGPDERVTVDAGGSSRVFEIDFDVTASISSMSITGGNAVGDDGGGLTSFGNLTLTKCTISGNSTTASGSYGGHGGGLSNSGTATLTNCTVSGNIATTGGGLYSVGALSDSTATLTNTILAVNTATDSGPDEIGTFDSQGYNLIGATDGSTGWVGSDLTGTTAAPLNPLLSPLGDFGGPTRTMGLLPGSPAIDAGTDVGAPDTDQRGEPRLNGVDIGAFESQGFTFTPVVGSTPQTAVVGMAFSNPLAVTVTANNPIEPVDGGVVRFTAPTSGASAILSATDAVIAGGMAGLTATANEVIGGYNVAANAAGASTFNFVLQNEVASVNAALTSVGWGSQTAVVAGRTNLPWANISKFVLTFNSPVTPTAADLVVTGRGGRIYPVTGVSIVGNTVTWTLASPIVDPDIVTFAVNPLLAVYTTQLRILPGDVNDDGVVNSQDMVLVRNAILKIGPPPSIDLVYFDLNGDGVIDVTDYNLVRKYIGKKLS